MKNKTGVVAFLVVLLASSSSQAADPLVACQQGKLKAQGKLEACLARSTAGVLGGKPDSSAACRAKFQEALDKADAKAEAAGTSCRFIDNGDGSLSDLNTGLEWEQKENTSCGLLSDQSLHCYARSWTWTFDGGGFTGPIAVSLLYGTAYPTATEGTAACFAGHCDWRVPTVEEARGIVDPACSGGWCLDPLFGPAWDVSSPRRMWTRTTKSDLTITAFLADLTTGEIGTFSQSKGSGARVYLVRGGL